MPPTDAWSSSKPGTRMSKSHGCWSHLRLLPSALRLAGDSIPGVFGLPPDTICRIAGIGLSIGCAVLGTLVSRLGVAIRSCRCVCIGCLLGGCVCTSPKGILQQTSMFQPCIGQATLNTTVGGYCPLHGWQRSIAMQLKSVCKQLHQPDLHTAACSKYRLRTAPCTKSQAQ